MHFCVARLGYSPLMDTTDTTLGDRILFHGDLPLAWRVAVEEPTEGELAGLNEDNATLLRLFAVLDEYAAESVDGNPELMQAIARLDAKISLVLELVGDVLRRQLQLPPPRQIALSELGVHWTEPPTAEAASAAGRPVHLDLYLKPSFPRPLRFFAHMTVVHEDAGERFVAQFRGVGEDVRDGLAKLIFRHHRRLVASRRGA